MLRSSFVAAFILTLVGSGAQAQSLPPIPGSTVEYQTGLEQAATNGEDKGVELYLQGCDKGDAGACSQLAMISADAFALAKRARPSATQEDFAKRADTLLRQRCSPTTDLDDGCTTYSAILSQLALRGYRDLVLEGGRLLASRCLLGKSAVNDCALAEFRLENGTPAERAALADWVDSKFAAACESGDATVCSQGFFRKYDPMTEGLFKRLVSLADASRKGCEGGSPAICIEASMFLFEYTKEGRPLAVDFMGVACQLPPKAGEQDIKQGACDTEKKMRDAIAKGD